MVSALGKVGTYPNRKTALCHAVTLRDTMSHPAQAQRPPGIKGWWPSGSGLKALHPKVPGSHLGGVISGETPCPIQSVSLKVA